MSSTDCAAVLARIKALTRTESDAELARAIGISPQTLSSWKVRDSVPYSICVELAVQQRCSLDWLLLGVDAQARAASDAAAQALLAQLRTLGPEDLRAISRVIEEKQQLRALEQQVAALTQRLDTRG